ncbi:MAG: hypothetical protein ABI374_04820 [Ginsengibacter sp.]
MPEIIIKYKNKRTLEALYDFAKYFEFEISLPVLSNKKENQINLNDITIIPADPSVDTKDMNDIFTGRNIDPSKLRINAWKRKK